MKAVWVRQAGGADVAVVEESDRPQPGAGEVLVKVKAMGINPVDAAICAGYLQEYFPLPYRLGSDFAGDIEAVGEGVSSFQVGDAVYGARAGYGGAFADYVAVSADWIAKKPNHISYTDAAGVPHAGQTAWQAIFTNGNLNAGQRILIHAAAGGVGHLAVQFAKVKGAYVIGTGSAGSEAFIRGLGADEFVDYNAAPFETVVKDVDVVLDGVGYDTAERSIKVLKSGGTLVCVVTPPPFEVAAQHGVQAKYVGMQPSGAHLAEITELIDSGQVKVNIQQVMKYEQVQDAIRLIQGRHVRGKIVLTVD